MWIQFVSIFIFVLLRLDFATSRPCRLMVLFSDMEFFLKNLSAQADEEVWWGGGGAARAFQLLS